MSNRLTRALRRRRGIFGTVLELAGAALLVAAGWAVAPALGLAAGGVALGLVGFTLGGDES